MTALGFFLRLGRWGVAGFAAIAFTSTFVQATAFYRVAGHSPEEQAAFGRSMTSIAANFSAVFAAPLRPDTVGGYVWWRSYEALAIVFAVWAMASATAMVRSDERRGVIAAVLSTGQSRLRTIAARMIAFAIAVSAATLVGASGLIASVVTNGGAIERIGLLEASLLLAVLSLSSYAIALLIAQITPTRAATGAAGAVLLCLFLINSLSRTFASLSLVRWLSPFRYLDLNQPLAPGGSFDVRSVVVLAAIAIAGLAASAIAFARRDLNSPLVVVPAWSHRVSREPSRAPWWRVPLARELYERRTGLLVWWAGIIACALVFVWVTKATIQPLLAIPTLVPYFGELVKGSVYPAVLGYVWFNFAELLFAALAIAQVARWSAEDADGRLELVLSQPRSRAGVIIERMLVVIVAAAVIAAASGLVVFYASRAQGVELDGARLATASLMLVPLALVFAAVGALLAAWNPRAAVGLLGGLAFLGFLDTEVGPLLKFPLWVQDLSPFKLFGTPLVSGLDVRALAIMLAIALAGLGSSILAMQRRDVGA